MTPSSRTWSRAVTVCAQLQSWTQALELGQAASRPSPKELGRVCVEFQSVGSHPAADFDNTVCQLNGCRDGVLVVTMQVQLYVIRKGMEGDTMSAHNVHEVGHIYYKQQRAQYGALWDQTMMWMTDEVLPA